MTYIIDNRYPEIYTTDINWALVFLTAALNLLAGCDEFLCHAIENIPEISGNQKDRMREYIESLLEDHYTLEGWIDENVGSKIDNIAEVHVEWALALSNQFEQAGF